jgi:hypothetical protein
MRPSARTAVRGERLAFIPANVGSAPASPGVYLLYRNHQLIYIGLAAGGANIREQLRQHLRGLGGRARARPPSSTEASALKQHLSVTDGES